MARTALVPQSTGAVCFNRPSICPAMPQKTSRDCGQAPAHPLKTRNAPFWLRPGYYCRIHVLFIADSLGDGGVGNPIRRPSQPVVEL